MAYAIVTQEDLHRRLAVNVRTARKAVGLTLKAASLQAEMHWRHWQKVEAAEVNVTLQTLSRIGAVLGMDPSALIGAPKPPGKKRS